MIGIARPASRSPTCTCVAIVWSRRAGHWSCSTSSEYRWLGAIFASRQSLSGCVPAPASTMPCGSAVRCSSLIVMARSALASATVPQIPVTTSTVDCISSWRIFGCSPLSCRPRRPDSTTPASCRSSRVWASMSCTSHSMPSVGPDEGVQAIATTSLRVSASKLEKCQKTGHLSYDFPPPEIEPSLRHVRRLVDAPHRAHRVADLAEGGAGPQRVPDGRQDVVRAVRDRLDRVEVLGHGPLVAVFAQARQPVRLGLLDPRIDAQRLIRLLVIGGELVHPDDHPGALVGLLRHLVGGTLDLGLLEALLDGGQRAAHLV